MKMNSIIIDFSIILFPSGYTNTFFVLTLRILQYSVSYILKWGEKIKLLFSKLGIIY